jgi:very-short-patch-repair endonuclease
MDAGTLFRADLGVYATAPPGPDDRLPALFLRLPDGVLLSHHSAAQRLGFGVLPTGAIHVLVPTGTPRPQVRGVITHAAVLPVAETLTVAGVPCVPPARCAIDLARTTRRMDALAVLDASVRAGACEPSALRAEVLRHDRLRGIRQARELARWVDGRAECVQESHLRLLLIDGRLPVPESQVWVSDEFGVPRYRIDLAYREQRVGVEYDGRSHTDRDRLRADRTQMNWLAANGWTIRYFTDHDLYRRPDEIVRSVRTALAQPAPILESWW